MKFFIIVQGTAKTDAKSKGRFLIALIFKLVIYTCVWGQRTRFLWTDAEFGQQSYLERAKTEHPRFTLHVHSKDTI